MKEATLTEVPLRLAVLVRCADDSSHLETLFGALRAQTRQPNQLLLLYGGTDRRPEEIGNRFGATLVKTPDGGSCSALNFGFRQAVADIVVILSERSLPLGRNFLQLVVTPFAQPQVAAVRCINIASLAEVDCWMEENVTSGLGSDLESAVLSGPNTSCCAIRKSVWEVLPFPESINVSEDKVWALEVLKSGYWLATSEAMFLFRGSRSFWGRMRGLNNQALMFYQATGKLVNHSPGGLWRVCRAVLVDAPKAALRVAATEILTYLCMKSIPLQTAIRKR